MGRPVKNKKEAKRAFGLTDEAWGNILLIRSYFSVQTKDPKLTESEGINLAAKEILNKP